MAHSSPTGIAEEVVSEVTSVGGKAAKSAAEEVVNIGAGVGQSLLGKKPKLEEKEDLAEMKERVDKEDEERIKMWQKRLAVYKKMQKQAQKPKTQPQEESPKPAPQIQRVEPEPWQLAKPKRPRGLPIIGKDWAEKRSGWGTGGG